MGEQNSGCHMKIYLKTDDGQYQEISEIPQIGPEYTCATAFINGDLDARFIPNEVITGRFKIHAAKTRKRFVKFLMASHVQRNQANRIADFCHRKGFSWYKAQVLLMLGLI